MSSFTQRRQVGESAQAELQTLLTLRGFTVFATGQEQMLSKFVHEAVRFEHDDLMVRAVRYAPDLLVWRHDWPLAWWEVKANTTPDTPNFAVEKACLEELLARVQKGERCVLAFRDTDGLWSAQWAQSLNVGRDMSAARHEAKGSHTPYVLIPKASALGLTKFIGTNVQSDEWKRSHPA